MYRGVQKHIAVGNLIVNYRTSFAQ